MKKIHPRIAITVTEAEKNSAAQHLAVELGLEFLVNPTVPAAANFDYLLVYTRDYLGLQKPGDKHPFYIDFLSGKLLYRSQQAGLRKELLGRSIGFKPKDHPIIIDATAGLGRDSFMLAKLGFTVTLLERSPIICALLKDAMERAMKVPAIRPVIERMHLICDDAIHWLKPSSLADVIYLDPMFPKRQKSASVKKEMVILQELLGKDADEEKLLELALTCARHRVVVKRPRLAAKIGQHEPSFKLTGRSSRFDVYLTRNQ